MIAGLLCLAAAAHADPSGIGFGAGQSMNPLDALGAARASRAPDAPRIALTGRVGGNAAAVPEVEGKPVERKAVGSHLISLTGAFRNLNADFRRYAADGFELRIVDCKPASFGQPERLDFRLMPVARQAIDSGGQRRTEYLSGMIFRRRIAELQGKGFWVDIICSYESFATARNGFIQYHHPY